MYVRYRSDYEGSFAVSDTCQDYEYRSQPTNLLTGHFDLCRQIADTRGLSACQMCILENGIWTAVGCIPTEPGAMIEKLIVIGLLVGGGISLIIILAGAFILSTSQGDPKKTGEAKEMITSALIGLVFVIFSVSILQLIGAQILRIPGFGE